MVKAKPVQNRFGKKVRMIGQCWQLYVLLLPTIVYLILFNYVPIYGVQIAFRDFRGSDELLGLLPGSIYGIIRFSPAWAAAERPAPSEKYQTQMGGKENEKRSLEPVL